MNAEKPTQSKAKLESESKEKVKATPKKAKEKKTTEQLSEQPEEKKTTRKQVKKKPTPSTDPQTKEVTPKKKTTKSQKDNPKPAQKMKSTSDDLLGAKPDGTGEDSATTKVKQFSFPGYKILSGASVAPVKMYPQKIIIKRSEDHSGESAPKRWAEGLFQNTTMSLKVRLLRWLLIWLFFRVLNKQSGWLARQLGVGVPAEEEPGMKPPKGEPGERFIRVFHDGAAHPFHVKVKNGNMNMDAASR